MTLLHLEHLTKSYPGVLALADVSLEVVPGEVHALVGENGAGKSTLARLIAGLMPPDSGSMRLAGQPYAPRSRAEAQGLGVGMVMQELNLLPTLTVAENIYLDRLPRRFGFIDYAAIHAGTRAILDRIGLHDVAPDAPVAELGVGQRQLVEIAAALSRECRLLILDEPTAALTARETDLLFEQIRRLAASGAAIIYISHRMEEIQRIAQRITVLRDGRRIDTLDVASATLDQIIRLMVGRELADAMPSHGATTGEVALRVSNLVRRPAVRDASFEVRRGEILGIAGLMGSGRTEMLRAIFGADSLEGGTVELHGMPVRIRSPRHAVRLGMALLTEDRKEQGLMLPLSIAANTTLANLDGVARAGWIAPSAERAVAQRLGESVTLRCRDVDQAVEELSGGNQQKVVLARWLYRDCSVLLFDEPTRGIDVGARFEVYQLLSDLTRRGKAVVVVSSDLPELLTIADRIAVMSAGRIVQTFNRGAWSQDAILGAALSGYRNDAL